MPEQHQSFPWTHRSAQWVRYYACYIHFPLFRNITIYTGKVEAAQSDYVACQKRLEELKRMIEQHPTDPLKNLILMKQQEIDVEVTVSIILCTNNLLDFGNRKMQWTIEEGNFSTWLQRSGTAWSIRKCQATGLRSVQTVCLILTTTVSLLTLCEVHV
jgi:hypothetical protein